MNVCRAALALLLVLVAFESATGADLRVLTEEGPPFQFLDADGEVSGVTSAVVREILGHAALDGEFQMLPWARSLHLAETVPGVLLYTMIPTPERRERFHWIAPVMRYRVYLWKLKSRTDIQVETLADANRWTIGVTNQDVSQDFLVLHGCDRLEVAPRNDLNIKKLLRGRIDMVALNDAYLWYMVDRLEGVEINEFEEVLLLDEISLDGWLVASLGTSQEVVQRLRDSFKALNEGGLQDRIEALHGYRLLDSPPTLTPSARQLPPKEPPPVPDL